MISDLRFIISPIEKEDKELQKSNQILIEGDPEDIVINNSGLNSNVYMNERNRNNIFSNVK